MILPRHHLFDIEKHFQDCLLNINHPLNKSIIFDSPNWQRYACPESEESKTSARYRAHSDGLPVLKFECKRCGIKQHFQYKGEVKVIFTQEQRQAMQLEAEKRRVEQIKQREVASKAMRAEWEKATTCVSHPYFDRKSLFVTEADGLRLDSHGRVLCPVKLIIGELVSTQSIPFKGIKKFYTGVSPKNGFHVFGSIEAHDTIFFGEGVATLASRLN